MPAYLWQQDFAVPPHPLAAMLLVLAFVAHNLEELAFFPRMAAAPRWPESFTRPAFILAISLLSTGVAVLAAASQLVSHIYTALFFLAAALLALNAVSHIAMTLFKRSYTPGVATAALLVIPASAAVMGGIIPANGQSAMDVAILFIAAAVLLGPVIWLTIGLSIAAVRVFNRLRGV
jgi:hypothetical protein